MTRRGWMAALASMAAAPAVAAEPGALAVVNRRMQLYNEGRLEPFLALYAPDAAVYDFPDKPLGRGREHLKRVFEPVFAARNARVEIKSQIEMGAVVINDELVRYGDKPQRYVSIYEVRDGLIVAVRFVR